MIPVRYNIRYLTNRWTSTAMTAMTFALVVATFIIVRSLAEGMEHALATSGDPLNVLLIRQGAQSEGQSMVSLEQFQIVRNWPEAQMGPDGLPLAAPEVLVLANKPKRSSGNPSNLQMRGVHVNSFLMRPAVKIVEGRTFVPGLREVIVSRSVANRFQNMNLGDHPQLGRGRWTVVGIFEARGTAFDSEVWGDYREVMQDFDRSMYSTIVVRARDQLAVDQIRRRADEDVRIKLQGRTEEGYYRDQTKTAGPLKAFGGFLAVIMSIGASFAGMNTMYASVANRVREIGTLRILGFSPMSILLSFQLESILLSLIGGVIGCVLALPMNGLATGTTNFETFSEIVFYFTITPSLMLRGIGFAVMMGTIGGFLPAYTAARKPALEALRQA